MDAKGKLCIISFDEISLKSNLAYQSNIDELIGLEDYGEGDKTNCLATSAIVFMAYGVVHNWKQLLAYFLVNEACSSFKVKEKLIEIINLVENIGLHVEAVVSDLAPTFKSLSEKWVSLLKIPGSSIMEEKVFISSTHHI